jgi:hypothetical protein
MHYMPRFRLTPSEYALQKKVASFGYLIFALEEESLTHSRSTNYSVHTLRRNLLPSTSVLAYRVTSLRRIFRRTFVSGRGVIYEQDGNINTWRKVCEVPDRVWHQTCEAALEQGQEVEP